ncbi:hypothetical protein EUGRSUZ_G01326 [Eucalyptus grandis]|uniref:Uncharacterized protein n=2 Tax=Eucalyptus grandis TaxID=71139 RepID=A0ACC3K1Z3_EUCGR|nr:hypothetical protein EUGRSUZ_G01326 [Eucalyptus grandis]
MSRTHFSGLALLFLVAFPPAHAVKYQVVDRTGYITGCNRFQTEIGSFYTRQLMRAASSFIWLTFNESMGERKDHDPVTLVIHRFQWSFRKILFHEMTHVWQQYGNGKAPRGLVNGIADYMRLRAGLAPKKWAQRGSGLRWDESYAVTAYFLDHCNGLKNGFVAELNSLMEDDYSDEFFSITELD